MEWTPGQGIEEGNEDSKEEEESKKEAESLIGTYNEAMDNLSVQTKIGNVSSLIFQLKSSWDEATEDNKEVCTEKAMEGCSILCQIIASNSGDELLQSCVQLSYLETGCASGDLVALMQAYKNAPTRKLKTQILRLYAYRVIICENSKSCTNLMKSYLLGK